MHNRTRRRESGKMLLDVCKYLLTVGVIGSLANDRLNVRIVTIGLGMALFSWTVGVLAIPHDKDEETR